MDTTTIPEAFEHTPAAGCACDLCQLAHEELAAWCEDRAAGAVTHQDTHTRPCAVCGAPTEPAHPLCLGCSRDREPGEALPSEYRWSARGVLLPPPYRVACACGDHGVVPLASGAAGCVACALGESLRRGAPVHGPGLTEARPELRPAAVSGVYAAVSR